MKEKRIDLIKEYILDKENVTLKELEDHFNVSMNTVRRDVAKLIKDPRFEKVYGGVSVKKNDLVSFENRNVENKNIKKVISEKAASLIEDGDLIYIDSGTTTKYILDYLKHDISLTIITNSLDVVLKSEAFDNVSVFLIGNIFKRETRSFVGLTPDHVIEKYNISKAFMAATAVSVNNGLMNSDFMEYEIKKSIVSKANKIYLLTDESKFSKSTLLTYAHLEDLDGIITDKEFDEGYKSTLSNNGVDIFNV